MIYTPLFESYPDLVLEFTYFMSQVRFKFSRFDVYYQLQYVVSNNNSLYFTYQQIDMTTLMTFNNSSQNIVSIIINEIKSSYKITVDDLNIM